MLTKERERSRIIKEIKKDYEVKSQKRGCYQIFEPKKNGKYSSFPIIVVENKKVIETLYQNS